MPNKREREESEFTQGYTLSVILLCNLLISSSKNLSLKPPLGPLDVKVKVKVKVKAKKF